jgi:hypothetical protein
MVLGGVEIGVATVAYDCFFYGSVIIRPHNHTTEEVEIAKLKLQVQYKTAATNRFCRNREIYLNVVDKKVIPICYEENRCKKRLAIVEKELQMK